MSRVLKGGDQDRGLQYDPFPLGVRRDYQFWTGRTTGGRVSLQHPVGVRDAVGWWVQRWGRYNRMDVMTLWPRKSHWAT